MFYRTLYGLFLVLACSGSALKAASVSSEHKMAILGLGGRSQYLLLECLQCNRNIRVVAVCDNYGVQSFNAFASNLQRNASPLLVNAYAKAFENTRLYPDTKEGLQKLFLDHPNLDSVLITSSNDKHFKHLNAVLAQSTCRNVYIEKPIFRTLEEFQNFKVERNDVTISIGLTLRYANMTKIIVDQLQANAAKLGTLKKMHAWERLNFGHALTIIMMNWRRFISLSGGLLLEKSIHDLDLGLFFMRVLQGEPNEIVVNTEVAHRCFKKSQKQKLLQQMASDERLKHLVGGWCGVAFQRVIPFAADAEGYLNVEGTIDNVFKDFPNNDNFKKSDIIPDYHKLMATCKTASGNMVEFELEVDLSGMRLQSERGIRFEFEQGIVLVDVASSVMNVEYNNGETFTIDLQTNQSMHAGGDASIAKLMLGMLPADHYRATFQDDVVQLASIMGLVSEQQAVGKRKPAALIKKVNNTWIVF